MKTIEVTVKAIFEIPDEWEIVEDGDAVKIGDRLNIFSLDFLEEHKGEGYFQSGDDAFFNAWIDRMEMEVCNIVEI